MDTLIRKLVPSDASQIGRQVFTDQDIYAREQQRIFQRSWLYLAHESQVKNRGDFVTAFMGETPVIVVRGAEGKLEVTVNSCSHRGLPVCRADKGNASRFVCPYHNWVYRTDGQLIGVPQDHKLQGSVDKAALGLAKVPRVETFHGLIFGSLDPEIEPLESYLGDMRFYLEAFFDRFPGGTEVIGSPHKWLLEANWKLPVENQLGDIGHAPYLHGSTTEYRPDAMREIEDHAVTAVPRPGHCASLRLLPPETPPEQIAWGLGDGGALPPHMREYLLEVQRTSAERLGAVRSRIKGMSLGVYPNFSVLVGQSTVRVSHPRGPGKVEYWSWFVAPADAPDDIKQVLKSGYNFLFGPAGILEQEDAAAWSDQFVGSSVGFLNDKPYHYGLGLGEEGPHPELPGVVGRCYNEHYARQFYQRWRQDMLAEGAAA